MGAIQKVSLNSKRKILISTQAVSIGAIGLFIGSTPAANAQVDPQKLIEAFPLGSGGPTDGLPTALRAAGGSGYASGENRGYAHQENKGANANGKGTATYQKTSGGFAGAPNGSHGVSSYVDGAGIRQHVDVTHPDDKKRPVIVFIHGGGWRGDGGQYGRAFRERVAQHGFASFRIKYRLMPDGTYGIFNDVMNAIKHVRENADIYNIDPSRVITWGDSAGGSLSVRTGASGKAGTSTAVGWSAPTNAIRSMLLSPSSLAIGVDHSTCFNTQFTGIANDIMELYRGHEYLLQDPARLKDVKPEELISFAQSTFQAVNVIKDNNVLGQLQQSLGEWGIDTDRLSNAYSVARDSANRLQAAANDIDPEKAEKETGVDPSNTDLQAFKDKISKVIEGLEVSSGDSTTIKEAKEKLEKIKAELPKKPGDKLDSKTEGQADIVAEVKADAKLSGDSEAQITAKVDAKIKELASSESKTEAQIKAEIDAEIKAKAKTEGKSESKVKSEIDAKATAKVKAKSEGKADVNAEGKISIESGKQAVLEVAFSLKISTESSDINNKESIIGQVAESTRKDPKKKAEKPATQEDALRAHLAMLLEGDIKKLSDALGAVKSLNNDSYKENESPTIPQVAQIEDLSKIANPVSAALNQNSNTFNKATNGGSGGNAQFIPVSKIAECADNIVQTSPALFADPKSPPMFLANASHEQLVPPQDAYEMRDKIRSFGTRAEVLILPGANHMGYDERAVEPTLGFLKSVNHPEAINKGAPVAEQNKNTPAQTQQGAQSSGGGTVQRSQGSSTGTTQVAQSSGNQTRQPAQQQKQYSGVCAAGQRWNSNSGKCYNDTGFPNSSTSKPCPPERSCANQPRHVNGPANKR